MDGVSVASSIISIATAGIQISIKLVTLSTQVSSASERVSAIGNDVSLASGVLHQLGDLMAQKTSSDGISIFNQGGLETTRTSAAMCGRIFEEIKMEIGRASEQLRNCRKISGGKVKLSKLEKLKWPFLQPSIEILRADLREAKATLMLMLQVATLALSKKMVDFSAIATSEQGDLYRAIIALHHHHHKDQEAAGKEKRLSHGSMDSASIEFQQDSDSAASRVTAKDYPPTLSPSVTPWTDRTPSNPVLGPVTTSRIANSRYIRPANDGSHVDNLVTAATKQADNLGTPSVEGSMSLSITHSVSNSSLSSSTANTLSSTLDNSSVYSGMNGNDIPQDYQMHLTNREQQKNRATSSQSAKQSDALASHRQSDLPADVDSELQMFMLKPVVKDFFDKIELTWSIQNPKVPPSVIQKHLICMEADRLPSVVDMLETIYDHEHSMIDAHQGQGNLLSLKRTKTDIQHRDIVFKDVPGLQFVVEPRRELKDFRETKESRDPENVVKHSHRVSRKLRRDPPVSFGKTEACKERSASYIPQDHSYGSSRANEIDDAAASLPSVSRHTRKVPHFVPRSKNSALMPDEKLKQGNVYGSRCHDELQALESAESSEAEYLAFRSAAAQSPGAGRARYNPVDDSSPIGDSSPPFPPHLPLPAEEELRLELDQTQRLQHPPVSQPSIHSAPPGGRSDDTPPTEIFKSFRVSMEDPVEKVLPAALKKYNMNVDSRDYDLCIVYADHERRLDRHEQPLLLFKQLDKEGNKPQFMLRKRHPTNSPRVALARESRVEPFEGTAETPIRLPQSPMDGDPGSHDASTKVRPRVELNYLEPSTGIEKDSNIEGVDDETEYSSDDDDDDNDVDGDAMRIAKAPQEVNTADEKRIVDDLLWQYTTLRPSDVQLPGGVL